MQDRPGVDELLEAVAGFLQDDVMPNTSGRLSFHARVAGNVIQMLRRELALEEVHLAREWEGLDAVVGPQPRPASLVETRTALIGRNEDLAQRIRGGEADEPAFRKKLLAHLRTMMHDKLEVSNPGLLAQG